MNRFDTTPFALPISPKEPIISYQFPGGGDRFALPESVVQHVLEVAAQQKAPRQKALDYLATVVSDVDLPAHQRTEAAQLILQYGGL